jgi:hypothetical protein
MLRRGILGLDLSGGEVILPFSTVVDDVLEMNLCISFEL